jgi:hypothetical protein
MFIKKAGDNISEWRRQGQKDCADTIEDCLSHPLRKTPFCVPRSLPILIIAYERCLLTGVAETSFIILLPMGSSRWRRWIVYSLSSFRVSCAINGQAVLL